MGGDWFKACGKIFSRGFFAGEPPQKNFSREIFSREGLPEKNLT
jgi:hypothetical protein